MIHSLPLQAQKKTTQYAKYSHILCVELLKMAYLI